MGVRRGKGEVSGTAFRVESKSHGYGFQQCGFTAAVFPHQESDRLGQFQKGEPRQGGDLV